MPAASQEHEPLEKHNYNVSKDKTFQTLGLGFAHTSHRRVRAPRFAHRRAQALIFTETRTMQANPQTTLACFHCMSVRPFFWLTFYMLLAPTQTYPTVLSHTDRFSTTMPSRTVQRGRCSSYHLYALRPELRSAHSD